MTLDIRCTCGEVYHTDPALAGRSIRCRCGRTLRVPAAPTPRRGRPRLVLPGARIRRRHVPRWLVSVARLAVWSYVVLGVAAAALLWGLSDTWWPATVLLFGPRWVLLAPAVVLLPLALIVRPGLLVPVLAAALVVLGPVMGYRTGWRTLLGTVATAELRLVTFNAEGGADPRVAEAPAVLADLGADVMAIQECPQELAAAARQLPGWTVHRHRGLCLVSRFPLTRATPMEELTTRVEGTTGAAILYEISLPEGTLRLGNLHLQTPRRGLETLRGSGEAARLVRNTLLRGSGSRRASRWLTEQDAELIAGDFNLPVESRIYRESWSRCGNAFSRAGRGFGWTRILRRFSARIDHVLTCRGWTALRAEVGTDLGSDHLPVIVDLVRE